MFNSSEVKKSKKKRLPKIFLSSKAFYLFDGYHLLAVSLYDLDVWMVTAILRSPVVILANDQCFSVRSGNDGLLQDISITVRAFHSIYGHISPPFFEVL